MRRMFAALADQQGIEAMQALIERLAETRDNEEFLASIAKSIL
jgi:transcription termination factor Rho